MLKSIGSYQCDSGHNAKTLTHCFFCLSDVCFPVFCADYSQENTTFQLVIGCEIFMHNMNITL